MKLWKKIIMIFIIGLGVTAVSASGQGTVEQPTTLSTLFKNNKFLFNLARGIEQKVNIVSNVSDLRIEQLKEADKYVAIFTVETTNGDFFRGITCGIEISRFVPYPKMPSVLFGASEDPTKSGFYLNHCQSSEAVFENPSIPFYLDEFTDVVRRERLR